jgi:hypothetical protein
MEEINVRRCAPSWREPKDGDVPSIVFTIDMERLEDSCLCMHKYNDRTLVSVAADRLASSQTASHLQTGTTARSGVAVVKNSSPATASRSASMRVW